MTRQTRSVPTARWVIQGDLQLASAARIGAGDSDAVDHAVGLDEETGRPLLPGTTLAGLLRSYATAARHGHYRTEEAGDPTEQLFGMVKGSTGDAGQSAAIVFDSIANPMGPDGENPVLEIRDGVSIDPRSGTAADHKKFDFEVIPPGVTFPVRVDVVVVEGRNENQLVAWLARSLMGLDLGDIRVGAKTSRGLGQVTASNWRATRFDLTSADGWLAWLATDHIDPGAATTAHDDVLPAISAALGREIVPGGERPTALTTVELDLNFDEPLLIGSPGSTADAPDSVHLTSGGQPVLTGSTVAGVVRHRAWTIAEFIHRDADWATEVVDWLFGPSLETTRDQNGSDQDRPKQIKTPNQSRLRVTEQNLEGARSERRTRIGIDRLTGGVLDGRLFVQQPVVGGRTKLTFEIRAHPSDFDAPLATAAAGLLVLVCRDVVDGVISFGGAEAIGYGFVSGTGTVAQHGHTFDLDGPETDALLEPLWNYMELTA